MPLVASTSPIDIEVTQGHIHGQNCQTNYHKIGTLIPIFQPRQWDESQPLMFLCPKHLLGYMCHTRDASGGIYQPHRGHTRPYPWAKLPNYHKIGTLIPIFHPRQWNESQPLMLLCPKHLLGYMCHTRGASGGIYQPHRGHTRPYPWAKLPNYHKIGTLIPIFHPRQSKESQPLMLLHP